MKNKIMGIFVCMLMMTTCVVPVSSIMNKSDEKKSSTLEIPDNHIIENVPYVSQGDSYYCTFATATMIFQYYGINTSLFEVCFNSGVGYSLGYRIRYPCRSIFGAIVSQEVKGRRFLAEIYGLNYSNWICNDESLSDDSKWQMYWTSVKENISKNIPVITGIVMEELPYYEKKESGEHWILLVGYNETNNTVCVHDSYATVINTSMSGKYIYIPIDSFKKASRLYNENYFFEIFKDTSEEPLPKKEVFELVHAWNIQKMKGDVNAYDTFNLDKDIGIHIFGVHALKWLKHSYNIRNILMLSIWDRITGTYYIASEADNCYMMYYEKHNMSQYLLENMDFFPNEDSALFEATMLEVEANNWLLLYIKNIELSSIPIFRIPLQISIVKEIRNILAVIVSIEKDIIHSIDT